MKSWIEIAAISSVDHASITATERTTSPAQLELPSRHALGELDHALAGLHFEATDEGETTDAPCIGDDCPECEQDADCPDGLCVDGTCSGCPGGNCGVCGSDAGCGEDEVCVEGECVWCPGCKCESDDECSDNEICDGRCVPLNACQADLDCEVGLCGWYSQCVGEVPLHDCDLAEPSMIPMTLPEVSSSSRRST